VVMGGEEAACVSDDMLEAEERTTGHPCPRREWPDGDGPALYRLVQLGAHAASSHLFGLYWRIRYGSAPLDLQERMFNRLLAAHQDEQIAKSLWPDPEPRAE
jgi:hypothetical protein